jgi:lactate dehydrogenase-like 2-hydroxyacid dehydrogenase
VLLSHPLLAFDNVIGSYHTAGVTHDSRDNMADWNAQQAAGIGWWCPSTWTKKVKKSSHSDPTPSRRAVWRGGGV